jgi:hypothetical protein
MRKVPGWLLLSFLHTAFEDTLVHRMLLKKSRLKVP